MMIRRRQNLAWEAQGIWHRDDDRPDSGRQGEDETWRRPETGRRRINRMNMAGPYPKFPDTGGDDDETEKKPEVLPQQPTPKQPPQPSARQRSVIGALRADQDPEIAIGPIHPAVRVIVENSPWDRGGVMTRQFHLSPYIAPEAELAVL